jgi:hypothetical protein
MAEKGVVKRVNASNLSPASFYVKGSYVLDCVFGTNFANDIDVFYLGSASKPATNEVTSWLEQNGLPPAKTVDATKVDRLDDCSGGGPTFFTFERWHIRQDGKLYTLEDTGEKRDEVDALWGPKYKTLLVELSLEDARSQRVEWIPTLACLGQTESDIAYVIKVISKMERHSQLLNKAIVSELRDHVAAARKAIADGEVDE